MLFPVILGYFFTLLGVAALVFGVYLMVGLAQSLVVAGVALLLLGYWLVNGAAKVVNRK